MTRKKSTRKRNRVNSGNSNNYDNVTKTAKNVNKVCDSNNKIKGLYNLGNTCYFNSMLQMILHSPSFMAQLKSFCSSDYELVVKLNNKEVKLILKSADVSCVEKELIKLWEADCSSISPASLRSTLLKNEQFKLHFSGNSEQDSHDAFLAVLNIIKEAQIKRIRKAILDYYDCKTSTDKLTDDQKLEIKTLGNIAEKFTLLHSHYGIVFGSALKCANCGDIRLRFDESLNIVLIFPHNTESFDEASSMQQNNKIDKKSTFTPENINDNAQNKKLSKHQLKKQKRIERKANRNKKSIQKNDDFSADDELMEANNENKNDVTDRELIENQSFSIEDNKQENINANHLLARFLGSSNENEIFQESVPNEISCSVVVDRHLSSPSNCSRAAIGSNSSRSSLSDESISQMDLEMIIDQEIVQKFTISVSIDNEIMENNEEYPFANDEMSKELDQENDFDEESPFAKDEMSKELDQENCIGKESPFAKDEMSKELDQENNIDVNDSSQKFDLDINDSTEIPLGLESKKMQSVFNAAMQSHQDHMYTLSIDRMTFESETDLDRALNKYIDPIFLENVACEFCSKTNPNAKTDHTKMDFICHLPFILPIYISRFKQMCAKNRTVKNTQIYSYPFLLNLSPQCSKYSNVGNEMSPVVYRLFGMIEHIGQRINSGHYVSYICQPLEPSHSQSTVLPQSYSSNILNDFCKMHDLDSYSEHDCPYETNHLCNLENLKISNFSWFRISDNSVEPVSKETVMKCQASMLFYTRIQ